MVGTLVWSSALRKKPQRAGHVVHTLHPIAAKRHHFFTTTTLARDAIMAACCAVCLELFDNAARIPHALTCGHEYCATCLAAMLKDGKLACPQDRAETEAESVACLPHGPSYAAALVQGKQAAAPPQCDLCTDQGARHAATHFCLECQEHYCKDVARMHLAMKMSSSHHLSLLPEPEIRDPQHHNTADMPAAKCAKHGEDIKAFDTHCNKLLCLLCVAVDHFGHKCKLLPEAAEDTRRSLAQAAAVWSQRQRQARAAEHKHRLALASLKTDAQAARDTTRTQFAQVRTRRSRHTCLE